MDGQPAIDAEAREAVTRAAETYCRALHVGDVATLRGLFHDVANLYISAPGGLIVWPREIWLERVAARPAPEPGSVPEYEIHMVDFAGPETALVRLSVTAPPRQFVDYLNFLKVDGEWRVIAKVFRQASGPAL